MYAAGLILGSILITGFSAKNLSSTLKYLTYIALCIATLYTILFPLILIYYLYQSYQAKKSFYLVVKNIPCMYLTKNSYRGYKLILFKQT